MFPPTMGFRQSCDSGANMKMHPNLANGLWMLPLWLAAAALFVAGQWLWSLF